jgi:hypothetical protein
MPGGYMYSWKFVFTTMILCILGCVYLSLAAQEDVSQPAPQRVGTEGVGFSQPAAPVSNDLERDKLAFERQKHADIMALERDKASASSAYLKPDELRELYKEVLSYQSFMSYMKIFLPVALLLGITLGGTLGHYFVRSNVFESQTIMKKELLDSQKQTKDELVQYIKEKTEDALKSLDKARISYENTQSKIEKLEEDLTEKITVKSEIEMMNIYYALSYGFFLNKNLSHAIRFAKECLNSVDNLLFYKNIPENELKDIKEKRLFATGDLAYYYADRYTDKKNKDDAVEGLRMARLLPDHFDEIKQGNKIALIDSYISVISRVGPLTESDKETWKKIFKDYRNPIKEFITDINTGESEFASYEKFLESIDE